MRILEQVPFAPIVKLLLADEGQADVLTRVCDTIIQLCQSFENETVCSTVIPALQPVWNRAELIINQGAVLSGAYADVVYHLYTPLTILIGAPAIRAHVRGSAAIESMLQVQFGWEPSGRDDPSTNKVPNRHKQFSFDRHKQFSFDRHKQFSFDNFDRRWGIALPVCAAGS